MVQKICLRKKSLYLILGITIISVITFTISSSLLSNKTSYKSRAEAPKSTESVVGGNNTEEGRWPFMARLFYGSDPYKNGYCDGTLIAPQWILTAAHCITTAKSRSNWDSTSIFIGSHNLENVGGNTYKIESSYVHPQFGSGNFKHDLALIKLTSPVQNIKPIQINEDLNLEKEGIRAVALGWGIVKNDPWYSFLVDYSNWPKILQLGVIPVLSVERLKKMNLIDSFNGYYRGVNMPSTIIAGYPHGNVVGSCPGDSGGPLIAWNGARWVEIGVTSSIPGTCEDLSAPGAYTRLTYREQQIHVIPSTTKVDYRGWINETVKDDSAKNDDYYYIGSPLSSAESAEFNRRISDPTEWNGEIPEFTPCVNCH